MRVDENYHELYTFHFSLNCFLFLVKMGVPSFFVWFAVCAGAEGPVDSKKVFFPKAPLSVKKHLNRRTFGPNGWWC